jgi:hypothetical protein
VIWPTWLCAVAGAVSCCDLGSTRAGGGLSRAHHLLLLQANAAVDDMAAFAEATSKTMAAVRGNVSSRIPAEDRKYAQELFHTVAVRHGWGLPRLLCGAAAAGAMHAAILLCSCACSRRCGAGNPQGKAVCCPSCLPGSS